jgi:adenylate cyclase
MAELIAQGAKPTEQWKRSLPEGETLVLGRTTEPWAVPWDAWISHRHAEMIWQNGKLSVRQHPEARNPLFFRGKEATAFELKLDEHFVIGRTVFTLKGEPSSVSPDGKPVLQVRTVSPRELQGIPFRDAPHRIDVLNRLPDVISSATEETELVVQLVNMLLAGIPHADVIGLVCLDKPEENSTVRVLYWDHRRQLTQIGFRPSQRLTLAAIGQQHTVLHVWGAAPQSGSPTFTLAGDFDWAFCTPVRNASCKNWGIYVAGRFSGDAAGTILAPWESNELGDDVKFTELVAAILGSLRQVQMLQRERAILSRFFSPAIERVLTASESETTLKPRETDVTVLFCDLRGFSRKVEAGARNLLAVLERVSQALGVMTQSILEHKGVIADFLGDAALGFWGWPLPQPDMAMQACQAALAIRTLYESFAQRPEHPLAAFQVGIGIATGRAVAGKIGTIDQAKVTVFGPIVNLASRLEGMTKILHVPILLDENTAKVVREQMPRTIGRCRRLARVKPYGMETTLVVSELLPPLDQYPALNDEHLANYEAALDAFLKGDWSTAYTCLHQVPPQDLGKDFLTGFIIQNNHIPPPGWDGVIPLLSKS